MRISAEFKPLPSSSENLTSSSPWWQRFNRKQTAIAVASVLGLLSVVIVIKTRSGGQAEAIVDPTTGRVSVTTSGDAEVEIRRTQEGVTEPAVQLDKFGLPEGAPRDISRTV